MYWPLILLLVSPLSFSAPTRISVSMLDAPGLVFPFSGTTCPTGSVSANGASLLKTGKYARLYAATGAAHGDGSTNASGATADSGCPHASNCFNVVDMRGRIGRGIDGGTGRDEDASSRSAAASGGNSANNLGSIETDSIKTHSHRATGNASPFGLSGAAAAGNVGAYSGLVTANPGLTEASGGTENQVDTVFLNYCVIY